MMDMTERLAAGAAAIWLAATAAGCATMTTSSPGMLDGIKIKDANGPAREIVYIDSTGYYFFWCVPLASGDVRWNEKKKSINGGTSLFRDFVGAREMQNALLRYAESKNCDLADVRFFDSDTSYAGASYGGVLGALFGSSSVGVSGVLIPRAEATAALQEGERQ